MHDARVAFAQAYLTRSSARIPSRPPTAPTCARRLRVGGGCVVFTTIQKFCFHANGLWAGALTRHIWT